MKTSDSDNNLKWRKRNAYYYRFLDAIHERNIRQGSRVLHVGCECGDMLDAVRPSFGVGIDPDERAIETAVKRFPELHFRVQDPHFIQVEGKFDYILICNSIGSWYDIQRVFENITENAHQDTRIIITYYNYLWAGLLQFGSFIGMRRPNHYQNWLPQEEIASLLSLADFETIRNESFLLVPKWIPLLSAFCNRFLSLLPLIRNLNLVHMTIARKQPVHKEESELSVSVIVPCRNEKGNIQEAVKRIPDMGKMTEIIFVDGNSTDGTIEEIEEQIKLNPGKRIKLIHQKNGTGKGDAVRKGFAVASGDILVIQDADLTAPPEDLPKFYEAIRKGKGDLINGSRMVYPMEKQAMRFLNLLGNKIFGLLFTWILGQRIRDTLCGTKMISRKHYDILAANRAFFGEFDPFGDFDLIFGAVKQNFKSIEVPVAYRARTYGATNINRFRHGWLLIKMVLLAFRKFKWLKQ